MTNKANGAELAEYLTPAIETVLGVVAWVLAVVSAAVIIPVTAGFFLYWIAVIVLFALDLAGGIVDSLRLSGHHPARRAVFAVGAATDAAAATLWSLWFSAVFVFRNIPPFRALRERSRARRLAFCRRSRANRHFMDYATGRRDDPPPDWPRSKSESGPVTSA